MGRRIARQQFHGNRRFQEGSSESLGGQPTAPSWNGQAVWRSGNFDPATKVDLNAINATSGSTALQPHFLELVAAWLRPVESVPSAWRTGALGQAAAVIFERGGSTSSASAWIPTAFSVGGGNLGSAYPVIHGGNYSNYISQALVQVGLGGVGSYGIFAVLDSAAPAVTVQPGVVVDGSILITRSAPQVTVVVRCLPELGAAWEM